MVYFMENPSKKVDENWGQPYGLETPYGVDHSCDIKLPEATKFRSIPMMDDGRLDGHGQNDSRIHTSNWIGTYYQPNQLYIYMAKLQGI